MRRIDYYWFRTAVFVTGVMFISQAIAEFIVTRNPGFEWVLPACAGAFGISLLATLVAMLINIKVKDGEE